MFVDSGRIAPTFDPHFKVFHELMPFKVQDILLVSSLYDAFIMEEDGSLAMRLINEYQGLNLSKAPRITRVSSAQEAFDMLERKYFDMVITMPYLGGMNAHDLAEKIKKIQPKIPVILVTHNLQTPILNQIEDSPIDNVFHWCCEADFLLAVVKNVEDHKNVGADTQSAMVRVIIYVEDSPHYRSFFLPLIYNEVVRQTQAVLDESLNERHRLLRMRARPKILMATNYEEAMELYERFKPYVFGIISDARFPKGGMIDAAAGFRFLEKVRREVHDLPMLMLSSEPENRKLAYEIPAVFIDKNSRTIKEELHYFFLSQLGFGDFVFRMPDETEIARASSLRQFATEIGRIPGKSLRFHVARNHLSNWVMARAEVKLAKALHKDSMSVNLSNEEMRTFIVEKIQSLRKKRQQGVVVKFSREGYDPGITDFVKMGNGSLGGKARGLAFIWAALQMKREESVLNDLPVEIPPTCVVTSSGFEDFIKENRLHRLQAVSDEYIADIFLDAYLPQWLRLDLRAFLEKCDFPLSVRSSSLLEDGHFRPYAGLYSTYFLSNNHEDFEERLIQLESAVKLVYASTWFEGPTAYARATMQSRGDDTMGVIIQRISGRRYGDFWYPAISGVVQSHNYYPVLKMNQEEGIAHIALGIGKTVVEGEQSLRFSPAHPKRLIQFSTVEDILANCQRQFYGIDMRPGGCLNRNLSNLVRLEVQKEKDTSPVRLLSSTYIPEEERIREVDVPGLKVMSFASVLKYNIYPLPAILSELLEFGRVAMGSEVEIEFAVELGETLQSSTFHFLQIRPMVTGGERMEVNISDEEKNNGFCFSRNVLGHGVLRGIKNILYVDPDRFDPAKTRQMASEIGTINKKLAAFGEKYLLIGPGRWGSADPWLGIPVAWGDISNVSVIVEVCSKAVNAEPSQGSHFFQNITSLGIPYLTVKEQVDQMGHLVEERDDFMDYDWLSSQSGEYVGEYVRHIELEHGLYVKCNGKSSEAVMGCCSDDFWYSCNRDEDGNEW